MASSFYSPSLPRHYFSIVQSNRLVKHKAQNDMVVLVQWPQHWLHLHVLDQIVCILGAKIILFFHENFAALDRPNK